MIHSVDGAAYRHSAHHSQLSQHLLLAEPSVVFWTTFIRIRLSVQFFLFIDFHDFVFDRQRNSPLSSMKMIFHSSSEHLLFALCFISLCYEIKCSPFVRSPNSNGSDSRLWSAASTCTVQTMYINSQSRIFSVFMAIGTTVLFLFSSISFEMSLSASALANILEQINSSRKWQMTAINVM